MYSNLAAVFAALAAGWAYRLPETPHWRESLAAAMLAVISLAAITWPINGDGFPAWDIRSWR